ncbi:cytochrome P450 6B5-like [Leptidea sinapis]|uniref:cytochrome P450 6B5-like n=1 Tax=Leptidea sinapis TaxID=189913 RepID=UPI0021444618|nr:cytochrome P450 6B5-like [Leptidea sinapis]
MFIYMIILLFICVFLLYATRNHRYWSQRNVKHDTPVPLFGNHFKNLFGIKSITQVANDLYYKYPEEKVVGYYQGRTPELLIRDLDIARHILNVDFGHFYMRGLGRDGDIETLLKSLFHAEGDLWKLLRQRLTPAFTTAKLKSMFPLIINCAEKLHLAGDNIVKSGGECDIREFMARFTTEFIGACGFGIEMDSINNENSTFRALGAKMFSRSFRDMFLLGLWQIIPEIRKMLHVSDIRIKTAITGIVTTIFEQRNYKSIGRHDFIDMLLELADKGVITGESLEKFDEYGKPKLAEVNMDMDMLVAQVFVFFAAGFETSSSASSFTLHQLALNPHIQIKVQKEIDQVLSKYNNKLSYDAISEMTYLDMAFKEGMRLFPSLGVLHRECTRKYTIPQLGITIDPGVKIMIPIQAIQTDEKYYDNPKEFRPERFLSDNLKESVKYTYLPFGEGPRACIGARLGHMQSLAGLAAVLQRFTVEPSAKTSKELPVNPWINVVQAVEGGVPVKLKLRTK